jgi:hypothetical protein
MSQPSAIPLLPLLVELLSWQVKQEEADAPVARISPRIEGLMRQGLSRLDAEAKASAEADKIVNARAAERIARLPVRHTLWTEAVSFLTQLAPAQLAGNPAAADYRLPDEASQFESALREYVARVHREAFEEPTPFSEWMDRLDREEFGNRLATKLRERFPSEMQGILAALPAPQTGAPHGTGESRPATAKTPPGDESAIEQDREPEPADSSAFTFADLRVYIRTRSLPKSQLPEARAEHWFPGLADDPALPVIRHWLRKFGSGAPIQEALDALADYLVAEKGADPNGIVSLPLTTVAELLKRGVPAAPAPQPDTAAEQTAVGAAELTAVERAMMIFIRDPSRSITDLAREVGCDRSLLYKDERFKRLRQAHQGKPPKGNKSKEGDIEAEQDDEHEDYD